MAARLWNGWSDGAFAAPEAMLGYLRTSLGPARTLPADLSHSQALAAVGQTNLPANAGPAQILDHSALCRLQHATGQSLPDLLALRTGYRLASPDAVATPRTPQDLEALFAFAKTHDAILIPYGGGTSVAGHLERHPTKRTFVVDMAHFSGLQHLDAPSQLATFGAGTAGPAIESALRPHGLTLGHYPQSFEFSTLGGWVATRSSGQESYRYGRIEKMFAGSSVVSPAGRISVQPYPASAAGPDVREWILGSEGRFGFITDVTVRVSSLPEHTQFSVYFVPEFTAGMEILKSLVRERIDILCARLSNPQETAIALLQKGHGLGAMVFEWWISRQGSQPCMLVVGAAGSLSNVVSTSRRVQTIVKRLGGGVFFPTRLGAEWQAKRYVAPRLRDALWNAGYVADTVETATPWSNVETLMTAMQRVLASGLEKYNEKVLAFTHLSHVYGSGSSLYTTYLFRRSADPAQTYEHWQKLKHAVTQAMVEGGGTLSHQHGVGIHHKPYMAVEKGELANRALSRLVSAFDPDGLLDNGRLL